MKFKLTELSLGDTSSLLQLFYNFEFILLVVYSSLSLNS